jgi:hypothetical protein
VQLRWVYSQVERLACERGHLRQVDDRGGEQARKYRAR